MLTLNLMCMFLVNIPVICFLHWLSADLGSNHDDVEEMAQSSQESLVMTEDSISSMDIDLNALEKVVLSKL